jgi:pyridoxal 5'-phosphate synthase pdxT subunit
VRDNKTKPGSRARVGILALQGDVAEHARSLGELGADPLEVRSPADLAVSDMLVIPGGESTTMSLLLESSGLLDPLRGRLRAGMPVFGTCAGMILLASEISDGRPDQHCLGAIDIGVRRNAFGRQVDSFETDLTVLGLAGPFHAVFIRAPVVERVGEAVTVLASIEEDDGTARPVFCRQGSVFVAAFHPELSGDNRLHEEFLRNASAITTPIGVAN